MQEQEKQITKLTEMLGNKLDENVQSMVKTLLTGILLETNFERLKSLTNTLLKKLGADILPTDTQNALIEKVLDAVQYIRDGEDWVMHTEDFKWDNFSETPEPLNEVQKTDYKWKRPPMSGDPVLLEDVKTETIKKSDYKWGADSNSMGSGINKGGII